MVRPQDMGPADLAPNTAPPETYTPEEEAKVQRNAFYNSLSIEAKARFLDALRHAAERGATEEEAWREGVRAAEGAYAPLSPPDADLLAQDEPAFADREKNP